MTTIVEQVMRLEEELERTRADNVALRTTGQTTEIEHLNELLKQVTAERDDAQAALSQGTPNLGRPIETSVTIEVFDDDNRPVDIELTFDDLTELAKAVERSGWRAKAPLQMGGTVSEVFERALLEAKQAEEKERAAVGRALTAEERTREIEAEYNRSVDERVRLKAERDVAMAKAEKAGVLWQGPGSEIPALEHNGRVILLADPRADETEKLKARLNEGAKDWAATRQRTEGIDVIGPVAWESSMSVPDGTVISFVQTGRVGRYEFEADDLSIHTDDGLLKADELYRLVHLPWEIQRTHVLPWQNDD